MKIALVSSYAFTDEPGGVKEFILGLKSELQKENCRVFVIAPGNRDAQKKGLIDFTLGRNFRVAAAQTEFRFGLSRKRTAKKILREIKPDIIVINEPFVPIVGHTIISAIPKKLDGKPRPIVIGQFHARKEDVSFWLKAVEIIGRFVIRRPELRRGFLLSSGFVSTINNNLDTRIAVSQATKEFWQKKCPAEYKVIYNGINTREFTPDGQKIDNWLRQVKKIILFAGRHDGRKGIDDLIKAFNLLVGSGTNDILLKITGKGEKTADLEVLVKKLGLGHSVQFVGIMPKEELIKAYRTADLVVASSTDGEGFNRTIIEARSVGALVVCTKIEGQKEAIGHDLARFMALPHNPRNLAKKIKEVLNLPEAEKDSIRKKGIKEVRSSFDWVNIAKQHIRFYESLIK